MVRCSFYRWMVIVAFLLGGSISQLNATTTYQATGFGEVTILSWTDENMSGPITPRPGNLTITTEQEIDTDDTSGPGGPNNVTFSFDTNVGDVDSQFSEDANTSGGINAPATVFALSDFVGLGTIVINNPDPIEYLVDIQLDWHITATTTTDSLIEYGFAAASIDLSAYTGNIFSQFVISDTITRPGLQELSGTDTFTVRIPANGMDEIEVEVAVFGFAELAATPEPITATLGVMGLTSLMAITRRRR